MISANITPKDRAQFLKAIAKYKREFIKTEREVMIQLGKISAKELAIRVQPLGISSKVGKKYEGSIQAQVHRAIKNANISGGSQNALQAHQSKRNSRGQVSRALATSGQFKRSPIDLSDRFELAKKKSENAGLSKGAWIAAGENLDNKKISGIPKWIRRHAKHAASKIDGKSSGTIISLINKISFVVSVMSDSDINKALMTAYRKNIKKMNIELNKVK